MQTTTINGAYAAPADVRVVGVVGTGSVGASWTALFLAYGIRVQAFDPAPLAEERARAFVGAAWPALMARMGTPDRAIPQDQLRFCASIAEAADGAQAMQENGPERPELKAEIIAAIDAAAGPDQVIMSSTGGIIPSVLQKSCRNPRRFVVLHPLNPAHLLPLVEVVGGEDTAPETMDWAMTFARRIGKRPIRLKREATGHMTNRLQFALLREAVHCVVQDIASPSDIDEAVRYGLAPRWALMGGLLTMHLAGGQGGMRGILDHAGEAIEGWWDSLGKPHLDQATRGQLLAAALEVAQGHSIDDWVAWRDRNLARIVQLIEQDNGPEAPLTTENAA
ncbi:3-hydroxyacyl-CoA dehydrogenase NAD-binding domain-containing protein [Massilia putida]|uniref:3-hydroxyacyl-CoA dehydrogenase NAD-binding domain-containing protein n=1 Tax=Massilia putida TaxID=1141883 RepID=UPI000951F15A|nr:3-hydroxyacyl-CoA dehydrogenase NAD-binding domain-containing protein [Massilia putida]